VSSLIPLADLIVSECLMITPGVRFELETAYRTDRWDRTVVILPPQDSPLALLDKDPLVQMFPRCLWADSLHNEALADVPVLKDLLARIDALARLPDDERRRLTDRAARDQACAIDLRPVADAYENDARWSTLAHDKDPRLRYYAFWQLFRAASIRGALMMKGDDSFDNRSHLSSAYRDMSVIMLDTEPEEDRIVLLGDLTFAEQCAQSAYRLIRDSDGELAILGLRNAAEAQWRNVMAVRDAVERQPERFVRRPLYGPFPVKVVSPKESA
jgi:hypothetical protein